MYWSIILVVLGMDSTNQSMFILKMATVMFTKGSPTANIRHGSQPKAKHFIQSQPRKRRSRETVVITLVVVEEEGKTKGKVE
jgi:hypothetical protein